MAIERFINNFQTTLSSGINDSTTSIPVNAATSIAAQFRARIDDEIIIITANGNTTTWTATRGAEGTSNVSHSSGATVTVVQTAGSFEQAIADRVRTGTYANLPATSDALTGHLYIPTDSFYDNFRFNGSAWIPYRNGRALTLPPTSGWTWDNQDSATVDFTTGAMRIKKLHTAAKDRLSMQHRAIPSVPYVIKAKILAHLGSLSSDVSVGPAFRQSSDGKIHAYRILNRATSNAIGLNSTTWTNSTTPVADLTTKNEFMRGGGGYIEIDVLIADNNTSRIMSYSIDYGDTVIDWDTQTRTTFLTADQYGFAVDCGGTNTGGEDDAIIIVLSLEES